MNRPTRPEGMTPEMHARLAKLSAERRHRIEERAGIIQEATGCSWTEADRRAMAEEGKK